MVNKPEKKRRAGTLRVLDYLQKEVPQPKLEEEEDEEEDEDALPPL